MLYRYIKSDTPVSVFCTRRNCLLLQTAIIGNNIRYVWSEMYNWLKRYLELYPETECAQVVVNHDRYLLLTSVVSSQKHSVNLKALSHLFEESGNKWMRFINISLHHEAIDIKNLEAFLSHGKIWIRAVLSKEIAQIVSNIYVDDWTRGAVGGGNWNLPTAEHFKMIQSAVRSSSRVTSRELFMLRRRNPPSSSICQ